LEQQQSVQFGRPPPINYSLFLFNFILFEFELFIVCSINIW
jgi:hypothetical protein